MEYTGCKHREFYRHDGGNYYKCNLHHNTDCIDSYSDFYFDAQDCPDWEDVCYCGPDQGGPCSFCMEAKYGL